MALYRGLGDNYLGLTELDLEVGGDVDAMEALNTLEAYLKLVKSLDCTVCNRHIGFQHRRDPNVKLCSTRCLAIANAKLNCERDVSSAFSTLRRAISGKANSSGTLGSSSSLNGQVETTSLRGGKTALPNESPKCENHGDSNGFHDSGKSSLRNDGSSSEPNSPASETNDVTDGVVKNLPEPVHSVADNGLKSGSSPKLPNKSPVEVPVKETDEPKPVPTAGKVEERKSEKSVQESQPAKFVHEEPVTKLVRPKSLPTVQAQKKIWTLKDMVPSSSFCSNDVVIRFWWSTPVFTISAVNDEERLEQMQLDIADYAEKAPAISRKLSLQDVVFARYGGEGFYRGCVENVAGDAMYKIRFLDYGDEVVVDAKDIVEPSDEIMKNGLYGLRFTLTLKRNDYPSMKSLQSPEYKGLVETEVLSMKVDEGVDRTTDQWSGFLYAKNGKSLNEILEKIAADLNDPVKEEKIDVTSETKIASVVQEVAKDTVLPAAAPVKKSSEQLNSSAKQEEPVSPPSPPKKSFLKVNPFLIPFKAPVKPSKRELQYSANLKDGVAVSLAFFWKVNQITVNAVDDADALEKLGEAIIACVEKGQKLTECPAITEYVLAEYGGSYFRARVDGVENDSLHVTFIDYGDKAVVKFSDCYDVNDEVMAFPIFGRIVKASGIPEDLDALQSKEIDEIVSLAPVMKVENIERGTWYVVLTFEDSRTYNDIVTRALKQQQ